jgi:hypothetical protein
MEEAAAVVIPVTRLGWLAGVVDLKGRLIYKVNATRATPQVVLMVESREHAIIKQLCLLTGTNVEQRTERPLKDFMRRGCAEHCPEAHVHLINDEATMPPVSRWTVTGASMVVVLYNLLPFLTIDRGYLEAMNAVIASTTLTGQGSGAVLKSLKRLYQLGWDMPEEYESVVLAAVEGVSA